MIEIIGVAVLFGLAGFFTGFNTRRKPRVKTLTDVLKQKGYRSELQRMSDAVLQLQNEILKSGALKMEEQMNGDYNVTLKVVL